MKEESRSGGGPPKDGGGPGAGPPIGGKRVVRTRWRRPLPPESESASASAISAPPPEACAPSTGAVGRILDPDRVAALVACDSSISSYDPRSWAFVLRPDGRNAAAVAWPLGLLVLWGMAWTAALGSARAGPTRDAVADALDGLVSPLLVPVSFLLVFRLGRAAVRFWDARAAVGRVVEKSRVLMSTAAAGMAGAGWGGNNVPGDGGDGGGGILDDMGRWTCAFPIAVKNYLRPVPAEGGLKRRLEIGPLLTEAEAEEVLRTDSDAHIGPIAVLDRLRRLVWEGCHGSRDPDRLHAALYLRLSEHLDSLTGAWGACERINGTPLPKVYVMHLRTFLVLYLMMYQVEAAATHGWSATPATVATCWGLLGIEAAAVECERPFRCQSNHLPLGKVCVVTARNVAQTLRGAGRDG